MLQSSNKITTLAFWFLGALNNVPYVVMLAGAKNISEGGTALVFLANIVPGLTIKLSAPYWFEKVSYERRIMSGSILMTMSFILVATFGYLKRVHNNNATNEMNHGGLDDDGSDNDYSDSTRTLNFYLIMQLLGVACSSAQGSLGEATLLALCGKVDSLNDSDELIDAPVSESSILTISQNGSMDDNDDDNITAHDTVADTVPVPMNNNYETMSSSKTKSWSITAFSSGTGLAGILGFAYVVILTDVFRLTLTMSLYIAMIFPLLYYIIYAKFLHKYTILEHGNPNSGNDYETLNEGVVGITRDMVMDTHHSQDLSIGDSSSSNVFVIDDDISYDDENNDNDDNYNEERETFTNNPTISIQSSPEEIDQAHSTGKDDFIKSLTTMERLKLTLSFWPFMIPLFIVYASEYALQSGVWTAIGFPVNDEDARVSFYIKSNWMYQVGVFISRSSGAFCMAPMCILWLMPILQCVNLVVFYFIATYHFWYNNFMLIGCFYVGLLGGAVYVNGYMRVNKDLPVSIREFALSTVSIADSLGIVFADFSGLFIQSCLYESNGIHGAVVQCPI